MTDVQRAKLYLEKKDIANAMSDMQKVLSIDTTTAEYFVTVADVHFAAGKTGRSKAALEKCLSLDPKNKDANMKLAELYPYWGDSHQELLDVIELLTPAQIEAAPGPEARVSRRRMPAPAR